MTAVASGGPRDLSDPPISLLQIGPVGGVDSGTAPHYVAPSNLVSSTNFTLNTQFGGLTTALGRAIGFTLPLDSNSHQRVVTGITGLEAVGQPTTFIIAATNLATSRGELWSSELGGSPSQLTLPTVPSTGGAFLSPNLQTYFAILQGWIFLTNGVDTPLKINSSLLVTQWGILAPGTAPTLTGTVGGNLTQNATYTYCVTFSTALQESSQGIISSSLTLTTTSSSSSTTISGSPTAGDILAVQFAASFPNPAHPGGAPIIIKTSVSTNPLTGSESPSAAALLLASAVSAQLPFGITAVSVGASITYSSPAASTTWLNISSTSFTFTPSSGNFSGGTIEDQIDLTNIPVSSDSQVTARNIYRIGGALGQWRLVGTINDNTTTTFNDGLADTAVTGQSLTIYRDPPPPFAYITVHQNRIFGFGAAALTLPTGTIAANSGALWWTNYNEPWGFNSNTGILYANSTSLDDGAVALASLGSMMICHKKRSFFFLYGNTDLSFQLYLGGNVGCTSARSVAVAFGIDIWESRQGVYFYNGAGFDPVGNNLSSGKFQQSNIKGFLDGLAVADRAVSCSFWYDTMYHISFPTQNVTYFYDFRSQQWMTLSWATPVAWYDIEDQIDVVGANNTTTGEVDQWFAVGTDLGSAITSTIVSRRSVGDHTEGVKVADFVVLNCPVQADVEAAIQLTLNPGANQILVPSSPLTFDLGTGNPTHIQDLPNNEWFEMLLTASITSSSQTTVNEMSVWGWIMRSLPATLNDGP